MDTQPTAPIPTDVLLKRIDAMMRELVDLRQLILARAESQARPADPDLVARLAGCLGQGSWDEYEDDVEWERFEQ